MFETFLIVAALTAVDPVGDVVGAGSLEPPTAAVYRNLAPFDLLGVTVADEEQLTVLIELGSLTNPFELPLGFSLPVIEVYLEGGRGGRAELLEGSRMRLPNGRSWEVALRLTGEGAAAYRASEDGTMESVTPEVEVDGNVLTVSTPFARPSRARVYAMTGLYDLFGTSPWRPVEATESPWAFSNETQRTPVVDVLTDDSSAQRQAVETGVLVAGGSRATARGAVWLVLMAVGLLVALAGIAMRTFSRRTPVPVSQDGERPPEGEAAPAAEVAAGAAAVEPDSEGSSAVSPSPADLTDRDSDPWDSSALLTRADDDDFADEFPAAEPATGGVWARPVPLRIERTDPAASADDDDSEPEVVTDDENSGVAGEGDGAEPEPEETEEETEEDDPPVR
ncbi:MAG: glucodextranase DOMON-like domain-containing protein [Trueperaceae bacterium]